MRAVSNIPNKSTATGWTTKHGSRVYKHCLAFLVLATFSLPDFSRGEAMCGTIIEATKVAAYFETYGANDWMGKWTQCSKWALSVGSSYHAAANNSDTGMESKVNCLGNCMRHFVWTACLCANIPRGPAETAIAMHETPEDYGSALSRFNNCPNCLDHEIDLKNNAAGCNFGAGYTGTNPLGPPSYLECNSGLSCFTPSACEAVVTAQGNFVNAALDHCMKTIYKPSVPEITWSPCTDCNRLHIGFMMERRPLEETGARVQWEVKINNPGSGTNSCGTPLPPPPSTTSPPKGICKEGDSLSECDIPLIPDSVIHLVSYTLPSSPFEAGGWYQTPCRDGGVNPTCDIDVSAALDCGGYPCNGAQATFGRKPTPLDFPPVLPP